MTSSVLAAFDAATAEAEAFANHPIAKSGLEEQILYLQGLSLVMNVDDDIDQREQEYLKILLNSFGLDAGMLEGLNEFAKNPDKGTIQGFVTCFRRRSIAPLFLFDALIMSHRDGLVHEHETTLIKSMVDKLEIKSDTQKAVRTLFASIQNKDWDQCRFDLKSSSIDAQYFEYYLQYQGVNVGQKKSAKANSSNSRSSLSLALKKRLSVIRSGSTGSETMNSVANTQELFRLYQIYTVSASSILDGCSIDNLILIQTHGRNLRVKFLPLLIIKIQINPNRFACLVRQKLLMCI